MILIFKKRQLSVKLQTDIIIGLNLSLNYKDNSWISKPYAL